MQRTSLHAGYIITICSNKDMYYFVGWLVELDWHDRTIVRGRESGKVYQVHSEQLRAPMGRWKSQPVDNEQLMTAIQSVL